MKRRFAWIARIPGSPRQWLMLASAGVLGLAFIEVVEWVFEHAPGGSGDAQALDSWLMGVVGAWRGATFTQVMVFLTHLGSFSFLTAVTLILAAVLWRFRDRLAVAHLIIALSGAAMIPEALKQIFGRVRPSIIEHLVGANGLSFPSGHSFGSATAYTTFAFFGARWLKSVPAETASYVVAWVLIAAIGFSRVYLGVHYPSDVLAGWCGGGAWSFLVAAVFTYYYRRERAVKRPRE